MITKSHSALTPQAAQLGLASSDCGCGTVSAAFAMAVTGSTATFQVAPQEADLEEAERERKNQENVLGDKVPAVGL